MKTLCGLAVLALGLWSVTAAWGDVAINGNELLRRCTVTLQALDGGMPVSHYEHYDTGYCMGLIHGIANVAHGLHLCAAPPYQVCLPGVPHALEQLIRVVQRYLQTHPA